jgi:TonB family protein
VNRGKSCIALLLTRSIPLTDAGDSRTPRLYPIYFLFSAWLCAQSNSDDVIRIGPGVTPPRILRKVEPEYSPIARADHIQGTLVLQLVVDDQGRPTDITVLSPLGFGLDEQAISAVQTWRFAAGKKDGKSVKILATLETTFRFPDMWFDERAERQRTAFNVALQDLNPSQKRTPAIVDQAVKSIQDLAKKNFTPAVYQLGAWEIEGNHLPKNAEGGLALVRQAAAKNYGPALYQVALRMVEGRDEPKDVAAGFEKMRHAALLGSPQAQYDLGNRYEKGDAVPQEFDRARRYFQLCAAQRIAQCQFRLGTLLFNLPERPERDYVQAVALFQLAAEGGVVAAGEIVARETPKLTPSQAAWVTTLKSQLVRR